MEQSRVGDGTRGRSGWRACGRIGGGRVQGDGGGR